MTPPAHTNRLIHETSPYLLQHAHNPVDWYPWGEEAFRVASERDVPILLSVGYSACHWCHVMERESFEDPDIAAQMNAGFVCVKVDREERPDVDDLYMNAVQILTGQGGWPMTVFLTPDGRPFYGGTYFPPRDMPGRPGLPQVLKAVSDAWARRRGEIDEQGSRMLDHIRQSTLTGQAEGPTGIDLGDLTGACEYLERVFDEKLGGFGDAPKFPQPMICEFLLRYAARTGRVEVLRLLTVTLDQMAAGGIRDHLGGGFHRYSTDRYWLVPHFEKMLYDNAQLASAYLHAWQATQDPLYRQVAEETLDYLRREMADPAGGFYSSQDADSEGEEGRFYVWRPAEVEKTLGPDDAALFCRCYDVTPRGNWEGENVLNLAVEPAALARSLHLDPEVLAQRLAGMRRRLWERREQRPHPGRDDKVLTVWNGLALAAFADAAAVLGREDYLQTAVANAEFVLRELWGNGRLMRGGRRVAAEQHDAAGQEPGRATGFRASPVAGFLEDYACYAFGLLRLYEATFQPRWLSSARDLCDAMLERFGDPDGGFFAAEAGGADATPVRPRSVLDNATPSGNSVAADVLLRLAVLTGEDAYRERAQRALLPLKDAMAEHPLAFGRLLCAADFALGPVQELAIVGPLGSSETRPLIEVARDGYRPNLVIAAGDPADPAASAVPLLAERPLLAGQPAAYVCEDRVCLKPTTDPAELRAQLDGEMGAAA